MQLEKGRWLVKHSWEDKSGNKYAPFEIIVVEMAPSCLYCRTVNGWETVDNYSVIERLADKE